MTEQQHKTILANGIQAKKDIKQIKKLQKRLEEIGHMMQCGINDISFKKLQQEIPFLAQAIRKLSTDVKRLV